MNSKPEIRIFPPDLKWREDGDGGLESSRFGDIYFSTQDGLAETRHVFLSGIGAPEIWDNSGRFVIGELGFGSGLNFLKTWSVWRETAPADARLHYVAVEGFPMRSEEMSRSLGAFDTLAELRTELVQKFPVLHPGFHRIQLEGGRVSLTLLFGPVQTMLESLIATMDAWYLDGFAPRRNPDMWTPGVFAAIARMSRSGTRLATFTAAGQVRRDLQEAGFKMEKVAGFGEKRECMRGEFTGQREVSGLAPWYDMPKAVPPGARTAIIGGGVSGAALAYALKGMSAEVTLYERHPSPAAEASGNPAGLLQPRPADPRTPYARFQTDAYLHALGVYEGLAANGAKIWKGPRGIISLARDDAFLERYKNWISDHALPPTHARMIDAGEMKQLAGVELRSSGVFFPQAGTIDPAAVCRALLEGTACQFNADIAAIIKTSEGWQLVSGAGVVLAEVDCVILANGVDVTRLSPSSALPLNAKRGQISAVAATEASRKLKVGLSYGGYATPAVAANGEGCHILGATYELWPDWENTSWLEVRDSDHAKNLELLGQRSTALPAVFGRDIKGGRASLRTTTADHLPVIGPLFNDADFEKAYGNLKHGRPAHLYPPASTLPGPAGLYVCTAFGSRGFALATLAAEVLVAEMFGLPIPAEKSVIEAIHPARFLVRNLKRR